MKSALAVLLVALGAPACTVGEGTGAASGMLFVLSCEAGKDHGAPGAPDSYELKPEFFAGEPVLDIGGGRVKDNRIIIRMQRTGRRRELTDVLRFDVINSYEVARCVRGRMLPGGKPDYESYCSWTSGKPRLTVGLKSIVRAYLTLRATCPGTNAVASATGDSWIELSEFGSAIAEPAVPPEQRKATAPDFKVDFDERLHAESFHLALDDDQVVKASSEMDRPVPQPEIGGILDGFFDFDLDRGQGAQTFP